MSEKTCRHLDNFWGLIDVLCNLALFVIIGLVFVNIELNAQLILLGGIATGIVLLARFITVGSVVKSMNSFHEFTPGVIRIMTWGGLRGGISIALALSLGPQNPIVLITYIVVIFSILVQGFMVSRYIREATKSVQAAT